MEFLNEFMIPVVVGVCLCVGYVIKRWIKDVDNKYIPTIVTLIGVILSAWIANWEITPEVILGGMVSGLSSTGLYELFRQFIENKIDDSEEV